MAASIWWRVYGGEYMVASIWRLAHLVDKIPNNVEFHSAVVGNDVRPSVGLPKLDDFLCGHLGDQVAHIRVGIGEGGSERGVFNLSEDWWGRVVEGLLDLMMAVSMSMSMFISLTCTSLTDHLGDVAGIHTVNGRDSSLCKPVSERVLGGPVRMLPGIGGNYQTSNVNVGRFKVDGESVSIHKGGVRDPVVSNEREGEDLGEARNERRKG